MEQCPVQIRVSVPPCETHVLDYLFQYSTCFVSVFNLLPVLLNAGESSAYRGLEKINPLHTEIRVSVPSLLLNVVHVDFVANCGTCPLVGLPTSCVVVDQLGDGNVPLLNHRVASTKDTTDDQRNLFGA
jgi:hypothetical protein